MSLQPGRMLSHYRLVEKIGEGGMGVVWKAEDTTLDRDVAIKVLPDLLSQEPERLARFEREAKLLASLNHPNIATVHGLHQEPASESGPELRFLAMEMVEGEDLSTRLERGPLPVDEVPALARQIAAALEAAHSQGVVHRDLKPANVVVTPDGMAKVLDFGLAKAVEPDAASASGSLSLSPTVTSRGTAAGVILGTAAYMSPEQARGRPVDRRTDLWSFGCVLYECLTGVQLFRGETVSDSLAAILRAEPDWSLLPGDTPPMLRLVLRRCLTREPGKRLQDAGDARVDLEEALEDPQGSALGLSPVAATEGARAPGKPSRLPWLVAAAALALAVFLALRGGSGPPDPAFSHRLTIPVPGLTEFGDLRASPPVVSPDGRHVVFGVTENSGETQLWIRSLDDFTARPLANTRNAAFAFWSPDSREVAFFETGKIKRVEIATGRVQFLGGESSAYPRGGSWSPDGKILYVPNSNSGVYLADTSGGMGRLITTPDPDVPDHSHRWPSFLPDGEHFLFVSWTNDLRARPEHGGVFLASISGEEAPVRIVPDASSVAYVPPGYLLVIRDGNLIAIPFDLGARRVTGEGRVIATGVLHNQGNAHGAFSASMEGTLVYARGQAFLPSTLIWYDRKGNSTPAAGEPASHDDLRLSPSQDRAVTVIPGENGDGQIWVVDLVRGVRTRLGYGPWAYDYPVWSGTGDRVLYASQERGTLDFETRFADGSGESTSVLADDKDKVLYDWSRDGSHIAYWPLGDGSGTSNIWIYSPETRTTEALIAGEPTYAGARFSPDSHWIAYESDDSGRMEVFVQAFSGDGGIRDGARWQLSTAGGHTPHWRDDGREILYVDPDRRVMAVSVEVQGDRLLLGTPQELFRIDSMIVAVDATGDHERLLVASRDDVGSEPIHVVLNWRRDL
jgi:Tol biopolymer transport system component/tRNA A-37 threonylcarbamoyl transferase component Bud32